MNTVMTHASAVDRLQHYDVMRRRNAEQAYDRNMQYNGQNQKMLESLVTLLLGKEQLESAKPESQEIQKLGAGQMKQVALPIGKTLEETIDLWRDVRTDATSALEPTTADYQLAATASAKIRQAETEIALRNSAHSEAEVVAAWKVADLQKVESLGLTSVSDREALIIQKRYEQAISTYSFQVEAKQKEFKMDWPSFYQVA